MIDIGFVQIAGVRADGLEKSGRRPSGSYQRVTATPRSAHTLTLRRLISWRPVLESQRLACVLDAVWGSFLQLREARRSGA
jgi:hypothetical protein